MYWSLNRYYDFNVLRSCQFAHHKPVATDFGRGLGVDPVSMSGSAVRHDPEAGDVDRLVQVLGRPLQTYPETAKSLAAAGEVRLLR
jgi:hypothetical protein